MILLRIAAILSIFLAVLSGSSRVAFALGSEVQRQVAIQVEGCSAQLSREAQRILAIELRATLVEDTSQRTVTRANVACDGSVARISVSDPTVGNSLDRTLDFADTAPEARARLLALAVAELVVATWSELEGNPLHRAPPAPPPATPAAKANVGSSKGRLDSLELTLLFDVRRLPSRDWLFGGGARGAAGLSPLFFIQTDLLLDYAQLGRANGSVTVTMPSISLSLGASKDIGRALRPAISAGARAGYVWMNGTPAGAAAAGSHQQGLWLGPEILLQVSAWARARIHPVLGVSAGAYLVGVRGTVDGDRDVEVVRFWTGISAGLTLH